MDRLEAKRIIDAVLHLYEAFGPVDLAISVVRSEEDRQRLVAALGGMLRISRDGILLPIFQEFPDLMPVGLKGEFPLS